MSAYSPRCVYLFRLETKGIRGESNLGQVAIDGLFISDNQISLSETTSRKNFLRALLSILFIRIGWREELQDVSTFEIHPLRNAHVRMTK